MTLALITFFSIYALCLFIGFFFALISAIASGVMGGHHDFSHGADTAHGGGEGSGGHGDVSPGVGSHMPQFAPIGPVTIFTFLTCFGGGGMIFSSLEATQKAFLHLPLAILTGFGGAFAVFLIFDKLFRVTQSSSEARVAALVGHSATVTIPIPQDGLGEIAYVVGGSRYHVPAREENGQLLSSGTEVKITRVVGGSFFVKKS
jgi:membrane protein implicated in regulation of membrane protease activity